MDDELSNAEIVIQIKRKLKEVWRNAFDQSDQIIEDFNFIDDLIDILYFRLEKKE